MMRIFNQLSSLPTFKNAVITIGSFDGVHQGHQTILRRIVELAKEQNGESIVITFHPHPRHILFPDRKDFKLITTIDEKVQLLEQIGIDNVVVVPFSKEFASQSPEAYIEDFLLSKFSPKIIVIGYDHRFGKNRVGDVAYLQRYESLANFETLVIEKQEVETIVVSSTKIRKALKQGDVGTARQLLGHPFTLTGTVVQGQKIGTDLGFPTANVKVPSEVKLIPPTGIYAVYVVHKQKRYQGMLYLGDRPTLEAYDSYQIEVNIFDFDRSIYGDKIQIELIEFLREDEKFNGLEALKEQLHKDKIHTLQVLTELEAKSVEKPAIQSNLPEVSVVVLNYNGRDLLEQFLPSWKATSYSNYRLIIADNGSTDDSLSFLNTQDGIEVIELGENYGFAKGYNEALKSIDSPYLILLNSDVEVTPNWIDPIIALMEKDQAVGCCQPKILAQARPTHFEYAGAAGGLMDVWGYPFCRGRIFDHVEEDQGQYDQATEVFWASGAAFVIRNTLFKGLGGFDESFFAHMEEIDLCWRLKRAGYRVMVEPKSTVFHVGGGTLNYVSPHKTYLNFRNSLFTISKNTPTSRRRWLIPWRLILDGIAAFRFLLQGKMSYIKAIWDAHQAFFKGSRALKTQRHYETNKIEQFSISKSPNLTGMFQGSILISYFLKGIKETRKLGSRFE